MGKNDRMKWPYYFITKLGGIGKSYIINLIINMLTQRHSKYLLLAPTGVAAQNIDGKTIHSELQIVSSPSSFYIRAFIDKELKNLLKTVDTIIIDKILMVSAELFDFIFGIFATLHNNTITFGGINVIVVDDLTKDMLLNYFCKKSNFGM